MNVKCLLIGSAAAIVSVAGARAADAVVVAEPEPFEYVRICDVYGAGFYYIPGTETCLKIDGYMRYDIGVGFLGHQDVVDKKDFAEGEVDFNDTYYKRARFALRTDARSETELGTLRSYAALLFQYTTSAPDGVTTATDSVVVDEAYIELGGFRVGKAKSLFKTITNDAGGVMNDDLGGIGYGPGNANQIAYTFKSQSGFSAGIALEEGNGPLYTLDSYLPHVVAGVSYKQDWGGISAVIGYDSVWEEVAGKVRLDLNATEQLSLFIMAGLASNNDDLGVNSPNYFGAWGGDWAVWGGGKYKATDKASVIVQVAYDELEDFVAVVDFPYTLVPGLVITPEVAFRDNFDDDLGDNDGEVGGFLRFQRNF
ncbi:porin [Mesorhizobium sp. M5C.F.Ca.IN.020.14.1.1]|nr:porin [Mesorhizobium sp. M5C.F.Ca.IN.020.14.1.1]